MTRWRHLGLLLVCPGVYQVGGKRAAPPGPRGRQPVRFDQIAFARPLLAKLGKEGKIEADRTWPRNCLPTSDFCLERGPPVPSDAIASAGQSPQVNVVYRRKQAVTRSP